MDREELIARLEKLPKGGVTVKRIKGSNGKSYEYHYLQWSENGKQISRRLKPEELETVKTQLQERKELEEQLASLPVTAMRSVQDYYTQIRTGKSLRGFIASVKNYKKRDGYAKISNYVYGDIYDRVFILYGLRRTGKTTLIKQIITEMKPDNFNRTAFIQITKDDDLAKLNKDLRRLEANGYIYVFIDEVTLMSDFIEGAALLSDIYAASGMKIVLSGTDSLGFWLSKSNELYDRCIFLHTTFIPYREFENVLGIEGIDNYIQYGGTMSMSGTYYNEGVFGDKKSTDEYVDSAIAHNIQHSLKYYQDGGHFRHLYSLYEKNELTSAINRVVEDMNHRFTIDVLVRNFQSNDLKLSAKNLRKDRNNPTSILDDIDVVDFTERLKELLEIKDKQEQSVEVDITHALEIEEYLAAMDLICEVDIEDIDHIGSGQKRIIFTQPGLRYSQAKSFVESLTKDALFAELPFEERKRITERILSEIKGRMLEDIVLLETKLANPKKRVFKLQFSNGEFDMVVFDPINGGVEIYEIKYSQESDMHQVRHLVDEEKCAKTQYRFGTITKKAVLYRGANKTVDGIQYQNVEEYLKSL